MSTFIKLNPEKSCSSGKKQKIFYLNKLYIFIKIKRTFNNLDKKGVSSGSDHNSWRPLGLQEVDVDLVVVHIDVGMHLQELDVGQERGPAHAEERGEDDLVPRRHKGKVHRLHAGPINNTHLVGLQEFIGDLGTGGGEIAGGALVESYVTK